MGQEVGQELGRASTSRPPAPRQRRHAQLGFEGLDRRMLQMAPKLISRNTKNDTYAPAEHWRGQSRPLEKARNDISEARIFKRD